MESAQNTKYYDLLGIGLTANREEIAAAYRQAALLAHPLRNDKSKEAAYFKKFSDLCQAYEILSDPIMKRIYDKYGEYSLHNGIEKGPDKFSGYIFNGNPNKIFEQFFGSDNPYVEEPLPIPGELTELEQMSKDARAQDIVVTLECQLFEFYNGAIKEVNYARTKLLVSTDATETIPERLSVTILPGFSEETELRFKEKGHEAFGAKNSDLVIKFKQVPLAGYQRVGNDIIFTQTVSLIEALETKPVAVQTLDNRKVFVSPSETITPQTECRVAGEGMPISVSGDSVVDTKTQLIHHSQRQKGDLIVKFNIVFPKRILSHHKEEMLTALRCNE